MARFDNGDAQFAEMAATNKPEILFELGLIYATGRDGHEDMISAHKWFNIAASQGCIRSKARREEIAAVMTRDEIAKAQRAAREWMTRH